MTLVVGRSRNRKVDVTLISHTLTIGILPIRLRHCLFSSSLLPCQTSISFSEVGRPALGSAWMDGEEEMRNSCRDLGRPSLGSERIAEQWEIVKFWRELGRALLGSERIAGQ